MSNRAMLLRLRILLLLVVLLSIAASVLFNEHTHKVASSAIGGVAVGIVVSLILGRVSKFDPKLWSDINNNMAEARKLLQPIRSAYGMPTDSSLDSTKQNLLEMSEHPMVILLLFTMTWILWLDPAFAYSEPLTQLPTLPLAKIIGTHFLALLFMALAVVGATSALQSRRRNAP